MKNGTFKILAMNFIRASFSIMLLVSLSSKGQVLLPSTSSEVQFPNTVMTPSSYNLDNRKTKHISNFAFPAPSTYSSGASLAIAGWSTDTDGGFSFGENTAPLPPSMAATYIGHGAIDLPNVRDVQVGYLHEADSNYIVVAYYDNDVQLYGYSLYSWNLIAKSATFIYKYYFQDPNFVVPAYTPNTSYTPVFDAIPFPYYTPPMLTSKMDYNRISMDVNKDANKVVMVMTNNLNGYMYTAAGIVGLDTIIFSPNLPNMPVAKAVSLVTPSPSTDVPIPEFDYFSGAYSYVLNPSTGNYDYFDLATGMYVRYYASLGSPATYHYSYYPIDQGIYVTEFVRYSSSVSNLTPLPTTGGEMFSPLIRLKAVSSVTTPCYNPYYQQYYPDVAFGGDNLSYVFYANELWDLYVNDHSSPISFNDLHSFIGGGLSGKICAVAGQTDYAMISKNTADNRFISSYYLGSAVSPLESKCASLYPIPPAYLLDMRAEIDAPDLGGGEKWAITFPFMPNNLYRPYPFSLPLFVVHDYSEIGKYNIYVRSNYQQSILSNGSMGNTPINTLPNIAPSIAFKPLSITDVSVAWASKQAGLLSANNWAYIGVELNTALPYGTGSPSSLLSGNDYLHVSSSPADDCGYAPLISLSKHTDGLYNLYTTYAQEDAANTYSIMHKNKPFISSAYWRTTTNVLKSSPIIVAPNPFANTLHINDCSSELSIFMSDLFGRTITHFIGTVFEINKHLDAVVPSLAPGSYFLKVYSSVEQYDIFKLTKL